jgi:diguanylate cyclase (GGDEF)-like protein
MDFSVVYVDLDRFKNINDAFGHSKGDKVLIQIGRILKESVRDVDTVSRFGGDEFILILEGPLDLIDAKGFAEHIQENLNKPIKLGDHELIISASMGVVLSSRESNTAEDLIRNADIAMYYAKANGKGRCEIYSSTLGQNAKTRMKLESDLQQALINNEYLIYYQPIIDLKTARLDGFEALLRWQKKDGTLVYPNDILPVLENTGLIKNVGYWTLNEVCKQIMLWQNMYLHLPPLSISMNVSSNQIYHPKFIPMIRQSIKKFGIDANRLIFDIAEKTIVLELSSVAQTLKELQKLGVRIHLDDFGTGYSALGYLTQLPINSIKIDRTFINKIVPNDEQNVLLKTMLTMAKELNIDVVAEGIEKKEQLTILKKLGCDYGQGYFFKEGQNIADTEKYLMNYVTDLKKI